MGFYIQYLVDALSLGSLYALMALGLVIVYGILIFARKFWREMGFKSGKIEGTELPRRGKNRSR